MNILGWLLGGGVEAIGKVARDFITTEKDKLEFELRKRELELKELELEISVIEKVHETNIEEAKSPNWFIAGWRPFVGWTCGAALAYHFMLAPFLHSLFKTFNVNFELPQLEVGVLFNILIGMLGLAGLRTYEKLKGVENRR